MTHNPQPSEGVRRIMTAAAQLLAGRHGDPESAAFNANLILIVGGDLGPLGAMWLASTARMHRRHVAHLTFASENGGVPRVTFVHYEGGVVTAYEDCLLWAADDDEPVRIIRVDLNVAFQMSKKLRIRRRPAPVASFEASVAGGQRAVDRLYTLADDLDAGLLCMPIGIPLAGGQG